MFLDVTSKSVECKQCLARRLRYSGGTSTKRGGRLESGPSNSGIVDVLGRMLARRKEYPPDKVSFSSFLEISLLLNILHYQKSLESHHPTSNTDPSPPS